MSKDRDQRDGMPNEEAASWVVRLASDQRTRGDAEAFEAWVAEDPRNADDYVDHALLWNGVGALADDEEARAILRASGASAPAADEMSARVISLPSRRAMIAGTAALAAAASAAWFALPGLIGRGMEQYETAVGEQRRLLLADGSAVTLNTDSALRVELGGHERRLFLDRGQAHFQVARDPGRPFRVFVGDDEVRAIGTAFEVWRIGERAKVTLEEGTVAIYRRNGTAELPRPARQAASHPAPATPPPAALLQPGQQIELAANAQLAPREVDIVATRAWRAGRMILDDVPLGEVVADINRYGGRRIVLADPRLAAMRVSGVFHTSQPEALVDGVSAALPVRLARQDESTLVLETR